MTSIRIHCPQCQRELVLPDRKLLGRRGKCPKCGYAFVLEEPPEIELVESDTALSDPDTTPDVRRRKASDADVKLVTRQGPKLPPLPSDFPASEQAKAESPPNPFESISVGALPTESTADHYRKHQRQLARKNWFSMGVLSGAFLILASIAYGVYEYHPEWIGLVPPEELASDDEELGQGDSSTTTADESASEKEMRPAPTDAAANRASPTSGEPIDLRMIPAGAKVVIHLHPDQLWAAKSPGEELWACLPPIRLALESLIQRLSRQKQLTELQAVTLCLIPGPKGSAPDWAGVFILAKELKQSEMLALFNGSRSDDFGPKPVYLSEGLAFYQRDARTYVVAPDKYAADFFPSADRAFPLTLGLDELLAKSDRDRQFSILFEPTTALVHAEAMTAPEYRSLFEAFMTWFGPTIETVSWSGHVTGKEFFSEGHLRGTTEIRPARLAEQFRKQMGKFPGELLPYIASLAPTDSGRRKLVGRLPAMAKVVALSTNVMSEATTTRFTTVLPERAVPNLALGAILTWDESRRPRTAQPTAVASNPVSENPKTFAERFDKTRFDVEFARTRLEDAFLYVGEQAQLKVEVDGKALMLVGVTKNEEQNVKLSGVTAREALKAIFANKKDYPTKLCLVVDEAKQSILVTSIPKAEQQGLKQFSLDK